MLRRLGRRVYVLLAATLAEVCRAFHRRLLLPLTSSLSNRLRLTASTSNDDDTSSLTNDDDDASRTWDGHPIKSKAQLLHPHTDIGHKYWADILRCSPAPRVVVDATCGNGHDTSVLAAALHEAGGGSILAIDIQQLAIDRSRLRMPAYDSVDVSWHLGDHAALLEGLDEGSVSLCVFNLGYLPGGADKTIVTNATNTVRALKAAERAVRPGGAVSATLYPGHEEGIIEESSVLEHAASLDLGRWSVYHMQWLNQISKRKKNRRAPSLVLIQHMHS